MQNEQNEGQERGSGLAITQRVGQSTIIPGPLGLACSVGFNLATGRRPFNEADKRTVLLQDLTPNRTPTRGLARETGTHHTGRE